jgi:hypothetical protein
LIESFLVCCSFTIFAALFIITYVIFSKHNKPKKMELKADEDNMANESVIGSSTVSPGKHWSSDLVELVSSQNT